MRNETICAVAVATLVGCGGGGDGPPPPSHDLTVISVSAAAGTCGCTDALIVDSSVSNSGPDACSSYAAFFYLSTDTDITGGDTCIGSFTWTSALAAGSTDSRSSPVSWSNIAPGSYHVGMIVASGNDPDVSNNTGYDPASVTIVRIVCDLAVVSVDAPDFTCGTRDSPFVDNATQNNGPDTCFDYTVDFYLSADSQITPSDTWIGGFSRTGGLAATATDVFRSVVSWDGITPGAYYVGMAVDYYDDPDTSNNTGCDPVPLLIVPPEYDIYETNDTLVDSFFLGWTPGTWNVGAYIAPANDEDWFSVYAGTSTALTIELTSLPDDYDVYLYDSSGGLLASSLNPGTIEEVITYVCLAEGYYYIQVVGFDGAWNSIDPYGLVIFTF